MIDKVINSKPSAVVEKAEQHKLNQVHNEVANGIRSPLAPGFKFWPVSMDPHIIMCKVLPYDTI